MLKLLRKLKNKWVIFVDQTNKSLKEWNAIVEALGQGLQTIIIRKNLTNVKEFLLYPSFSYAMSENYLNSFKREYWSFVEENLFPNKSGDKTKLKYYAKVQCVIGKTSGQISKLNKYHIWNNEHVKSYLNNKKGYLWVLRVYKLKEPYMAETNRSMRFINLKKQVSIKDAIPVIEDAKYFQLINTLL